MTNIRFTVAGRPQGKGSKRAQLDSARLRPRSDRTGPFFFDVLHDVDAPHRRSPSSR